MYRHGKITNMFGGKAFRLFAALLCLLFAAPLSQVQSTHGGDAVLSPVTGPLNEAIEAVNATTKFAERESQPDNASGEDVRKAHGLRPSSDIKLRPTTRLRARWPENQTIRPSGTKWAANNTRAPPSLRKTFS